jgi:hypothetical protein
MKAITLRNIPKPVARAIERRAREKGTSLNRAVIEMLEDASGERRPAQRSRVVHRDLDQLAGSWTAEEAAEFERSLRDQRAIDPELWK